MSEEIRCEVIGRTCPHAKGVWCDAGGTLISQSEGLCARNGKRVAEICLATELEVTATVLNSLAKDMGLTIHAEEGRVIVSITQHIGRNSMTASVELEQQKPHGMPEVSEVPGDGALH